MLEKTHTPAIDLFLHILGQRVFDFNASGARVKNGNSDHLVPFFGFLIRLLMNGKSQEMREVLCHLLCYLAKTHTEEMRAQVLEIQEALVMIASFAMNAATSLSGKLSAVTLISTIAGRSSESRNPRFQQLLFKSKMVPHIIIDVCRLCVFYLTGRENPFSNSGGGKHRGHFTNQSIADIAVDHPRNIEKKRAYKWRNADGKTSLSALCFETLYQCMLIIYSWSQASALLHQDPNVFESTQKHSLSIRTSEAAPFTVLSCLFNVIAVVRCETSQTRSEHTANLALASLRELCTESKAITQHIVRLLNDFGESGQSSATAPQF